MAAPGPSRIARIKGTLIKAPTDLSAAYPYGGTVLGNVRDGEFRLARNDFQIIAEEFGKAIGSVMSGETGVLAGVCRDMDDDLLASIFLDSAAGGTTGRRLLQERIATDDYRFGTRVDTSLSTSIYLSPESDAHHGILLYRAVPILDPTVKLNMQLDQEVGLLFMFAAMPDEDGNTWQIGLREDLTL